MKKTKLFVLPLIAFLASCGGGASQNNGGSGESQPSSPYKTDVPAGGEAIPYEEPASGGEEGGEGGEGQGEGGEAEPSEYERAFSDATAGVMNSILQSTIEGNLSFNYVVNETVPVDQTSGLYVTASEAISGNLHFLVAGSDGGNISRYVRLDLQNFNLAVNVNYTGMGFSASIVNLNASMFYLAGSDLNAAVYLDLSDESVSRNLYGLINTAAGIYNMMGGAAISDGEAIDFSAFTAVVPSIATKHYLTISELAPFFEGDETTQTILNSGDPLTVFVMKEFLNLLPKLQQFDPSTLLKQMPVKPSIFTYKDVTGAVNRIAMSIEMNKDELGVPDVIGQTREPIYDQTTWEIIGYNEVGGVKVSALNIGASAVVGLTRGSSELSLEEAHLKAGFVCDYGTANGKIDLAMQYNDFVHFAYPTDDELANYKSNVLALGMELYEQFSDMFGGNGESLAASDFVSAQAYNFFLGHDLTIVLPSYPSQSGNIRFDIDEESNEHALALYAYNSSESEMLAYVELLRADGWNVLDSSESYILSKDNGATIILAYDATNNVVCFGFTVTGAIY